MTPRKRPTAIDNIPPDLLAQYIARDITSDQLAKKTGYSAVWLRKLIKRPTDNFKKNIQTSKCELRKARETYRETIAHLPATEIATLAKVSLGTAYRIKNKYAP